MEQFSTSYGLQFQLVGEAEIQKISAYDQTIAKCHISRFGFIIVDTFGTPIDNEFDLDAIQEVLRDIH